VILSISSSAVMTVLSN